MIKQLEYSVTFPSTGRTLSEAVLFQGGFGAIVGPNESGKTMIVEMVRFCLFGSSALRGKSDDYKNLKASLDFVIRNQDYTVDRTGTKAQLKENGEVIAVGVTPVNVKIAQILGFGLTVFDMACVANQNQLLALGEMKPAERRRAVDSVIGVAILDDLAKSAGVEALANKRAGDDLNANNRLPTEPVLHDNYRESSELSKEKAQLDSIRSHADQLRGWLTNEKKKPIRPVAPHDMSTELLQGLIAAQTARNVERQVLEGELARIPAASGITMDELAADRENHKLAQAHRARRQFLTVNRKVEWDQAHIDQLRVDLADRKAYDRHDYLADRIEKLRAKGDHTCPSCQHHWPIACEELVDLEVERDALVAKGLRLVYLNGATEEKVDGYQRMLDAWKRVEEEWETVHQHAPEMAPDVRWTLEQIASLELGIKQQDRRAELVAEIEKLKPADKEPDYASMLRQAQQHEAQMEAWERQMTEFQEWEQEKARKLVDLTMLEMDLQGYDQLVAELNLAVAYEQAYKVWYREFQIYNERIDKCTTYWNEAEDWNKVKDALQILRSKIKQYLVPSLNRVASNLISHMTGGERQAINVDEDFNILVDGQTIDTLSGSGKAVANLALRIGLGQVLTNNIFSLFMGDEIDESMDKNRAEKTAGVLHTLKGRISQLLLVSHKSPAADYFIAVGDKSEHELNHFQPD